MTLDWDRNLPDLTLDNVRIHASSLGEVWKDMSMDYLLRSVLVVSDRVLEEMPFDYESERCTVRELYDTLATRYGLTWVQDKRTGVTWFHPVALAYDHILIAGVHVARDHLGLPMQSGILEPIGGDNAAGIAVKQWGALFQNTFDYAVDVPAGEYTVRDILNLCCIANPTKTFLVQVRHGRVFLTAVNIVSDEVRPVPVSALYLWDVEIRQERGKGAPTQMQVMAVLAHQEAKVRHAARNYLEAIIGSVQVDEWVGCDSSTEQVLWTCLGVTSILVRSGEATHLASIETMERLASDDFLAECEPGLAVMTALDLARLTKDSRTLKVVKKRNPGANALVGVISDVCRVAALSGYIRKALRTKSTDILVGDSMPLTEMVRLSNAGKLEFNLAGKKRK